MKKLMVSVFALGMMTTGAMAGEQLTTAQMDQVTAGFFDTQVNFNKTRQTAIAVSRSNNKCAIALCATGGSVAQASNYNATGQANVD
jgi:hypothetical protein